MTRGQPKLRDVRRIYHLINECIQIGGDSNAWRHHMLKGLCQIINARVGLYMHVHNPLQIDEQINETMAYGFLDTEHWRLWEHYQQEEAHRDDIFHGNFFQNHSVSIRTRTLSGIVDTREWLKTLHYNEYIRACGLEDRITSSLRIKRHNSDVIYQVLVFHRDVADGQFPADTKYLVTLFHHEIAALLDSRLFMPGSRLDLGSLTPRMKQILECLLSGQAEKQMADYLNISPHTVNRHVQRLYRHFGVNSRAKLISLLKDFSVD